MPLPLYQLGGLAEVVPGSTPDSIPDWQGEYYVEFMKRLFALLCPVTYLEIGTRDGESLRHVSAHSVAIDPAFTLSGDVVGDKTVCLLFRMTSDAFFRHYDPAALLGAPIDVAFLDGMHLWEFLLRDFINVERAARRNSVVFMHDILPVDCRMTVRHEQSDRRRGSVHPDWWTGDVWKTIVALRRYRPDLAIHTFDAHPTGLAAITNLSPGDTTLSERYFDIVRELRELRLEQYGIERHVAELRPIPTRSIRDLPDLAEMFWV